MDMFVRLAKAISMLSFVPNTFYIMIKSKSAKFIVVVVNKYKIRIRLYVRNRSASNTCV